MTLCHDLHLLLRPSPPVIMQQGVTQEQIIEASVTASIVVPLLLVYCFSSNPEHHPLRSHLPWRGVASLFLSFAALTFIFFGLTGDAALATFWGCKGGIITTMTIVEV
ncbi:hypothetical protein C2W62_33275 [Candidatus Entotheonella serta]|nr:hypothetical protein C2W62_33275 [Candidatus Entotheonella serta]